MSDGENHFGSNPVKEAWLICVSAERMKSSADSISALPGLDGREAVAILPSGLPVLNEKLGAATVPLREQAALKVGGVTPPTMSVPTRSQSGCKASLRIHSCKSPVNCLDGADSHRKLPLL